MTLEQLKQARRLIENGWTHNYPATTATGESIRDDSPKAVNFSLVGALLRVGVKTDYLVKMEKYLETRYTVGSSYDRYSLKRFNLWGTKEKVLAFLDHWIEKVSFGDYM